METASEETRAFVREEICANLRGVAMDFLRMSNPDTIQTFIASQETAIQEAIANVFDDTTIKMMKDEGKTDINEYLRSMPGDFFRENMCGCGFPAWDGAETLVHVRLYDDITRLTYKHWTDDWAVIANSTGRILNFVDLPEWFRTYPDGEYAPSVQDECEVILNDEEIHYIGLPPKEIGEKWTHYLFWTIKDGTITNWPKASDKALRAALSPPT